MVALVHSYLGLASSGAGRPGGRGNRTVRHLFDLNQCKVYVEKQKLVEVVLYF